MKTKFNEVNAPAEQKYPCLMRTIYGNNNIYLMTEPSVGTRIHSDQKHLVGEYSESWIMDSLEPYYGTVTLEN